MGLCLLELIKLSKLKILTLGADILRYTTVGASEVLASWEGWFIVSQSRTTN